ncbi:ATP-binding protein [Desulfobacterales bacterium HSG17]|nr:ATP-binding protein [Desulfobacterales bacterium HSG17]
MAYRSFDRKSFSDTGQGATMPPLRTKILNEGELPNSTGEIHPASEFKQKSRPESDKQELLEAEILQLRQQLSAFSQNHTKEMNRLQKKFTAEIKDHEQTTFSLRQSEQTIHSILETIPDIIYRLDVDGNITFISKAIEKFGYSQKELMGKNIFEIIHPDDYEKAFFKINERRTGDRGTKSLEVRLVAKWDQVIMFDIRTDPIPETTLLVAANGLYACTQKGETAFLGTQGIARDITERKKHEQEKRDLEKQLRQAQKMEAIGTLAGGVAHDFNNIIFPIIGNVEMALDEINEGNIIYENMTEVLKAANRAKELVRQILAFSRQTELANIPMNVGPIIKEALKLLRHSIPSTIEIRKRINSINGMVVADPTQIHQIVMNLCTNAYHAMRESGGILEIVLEETDLTPDKTPAGSHNISAAKLLRLAISDTGIGMATETIERIFNPYFSTKGTNEGTGLGLSVVHGIVKSIGGQIIVDSAPGKGSTFQIFLPLISYIIEPEETFFDDKAPFGNETILLVDDEVPIVRMQKKMLSRLGYTVITRTSSIEALEAFRANHAKIDLVLTDMTMPNMTGIELAIELGKIDPAIPIILFTGFSEVMNAKQLSSYGIRALVKKPVIKKEVARIIRQVLDDSRCSPATANGVYNGEG